MPTTARRTSVGPAATPLGLTLDDVSPMLLEEAPVAFSDPEWTYEIKFDGYRMLASADRAGVRLKSRNGADATGWFPEVASALAHVTSKRLIVDGEVCVLDSLGRSDFDRLHARARRRTADPDEPVVYCVFDVLAAGGKSLIDQPLLVRKKFLAALRDLPHVMVVDHIPCEGEALYRLALELHLEGLVAKRIAAPYRPGVRSSDWLKIKRPGAVPAKRFDRSGSK